MRILLFVLLTFSTLVSARAVESPIHFARRFCAAEEKWAIRGIPKPSDERLYSSHVGIEIIRAIRRANAELEPGRKRFRNDPTREMTPHLEENLFSGFSEPPDSEIVGRSFSRRGKRVVEIHREYKERGQVHQWTDLLIMDRAGGTWVVCDIEYGRGGSLLETVDGFTKSLFEYSGRGIRGTAHQIPGGGPEESSRFAANHPAGIWRSAIIRFWEIPCAMPPVQWPWRSSGGRIVPGGDIPS